MYEVLLIIALVLLTYLAVRRLAIQKLPAGAEFDAEPAELGPGTVTKKFITGDNDEWIGQVLYDGVKWSAVLEYPQNGIPGVGSQITVVRIINRDEGNSSRPTAEIRWSSAMPPER